MYAHLIRHQWKQGIRSVVRYQTLAANILFGFIWVMLSLNFLVLGFGLGELLKETAPSQDPVILVSSYLLYYFLVDLLFRFLLQRIPVQSVQPYLLLPLEKRQLIHWFLIRCVFTLFNLFPLLTLIPFVTRFLVPESGLSSGLVFLGAVISGLLLNTYLNLLARSLFLGRSAWALVCGVVIATFIGLDYSGWLTLSKASAELFSFLVAVPAALAVPLALTGTVYTLSYRLLRKSLYLDSGPRESISEPDILRLDRLQRLGDYGRFLALELRMLLRNRRPRSTLYFGFVVPFFVVLYYTMEPIDPDYYPNPDPQNLTAAVSSGNGTAPDEVPVTFRVTAFSLPDGSHIYIAGNHEKLGEWRAGRVPLIPAENDTWERTFYFQPGTELKYKFTLGHWKTQRAGENGTTPEDYTLTVGEPKVIEVGVAGWANPERDVFVDCMILYMSGLVTGLLILIYGQFLLSWEGSYFDGLLARRLDLQKYFGAKWILLTIFGSLYYLLSIPLVYFGWDVFYANSAIFLYNVGINSFLILFLATWPRKGLDLSVSPLSQQGKSSVQYLLVIPTLIVPILIYLPFRMQGHPYLGLTVLGALGTSALIFHRPLLKAIAFQFRLRRYSIISALREK
jgi:hypothetical protein